MLESLGISAEQIAYGLKAADPPAGLWGVLGLLMKGAYDAKAEETREHIRTISTVLNAKGGAIRETANRYQKVDEEAQRAFQRFLDTMGGGQ